QSKPSLRSGLPRTAPTGALPSSAALRTLMVSNAGWKLPFAIAREAVVPLAGGKVAVAGGMLPDDSSSARAYVLTLATGQSADLPNLPVDVHDVAGGLFQGQPATYGGGNSSEQSVVQQFDGKAWHVAAHLPTTRSDLSVATVSGTTYVLGGYDGSGVPTEVLAQSGSQPVRAAGHLAVGVRYAATAVVGTSIYLFGGEVSGAELGVVQRYDIGTGQTTVIARLPRPLGHASAVLLGGRILLMGGRVNPNQGTAAMWWFDPATNKFTRAGSLPSPITDAAVVTAADGLNAWLLGGEDPSVRNGVVELSLR
ncbi:MAG TPA: kelch repeat-containing protein, partial [Marmoricola sp.]|nr:kelch repeat-containing protein [Marmoricola sp.]